MIVQVQKKVAIKNAIKVICSFVFLISLGCISIENPSEKKCSEFQKDNRLLGYWESVKISDTPTPFINNAHFDTCSDLKSYCWIRSYFEFNENDFDSIYNRKYCGSICNKKDTIYFFTSVQIKQTKKWFTINDSLFLFIGRFGTTDCIKCECIGLKFAVHSDTLLTVSNNDTTEYYKKK